MARPGTPKYKIAGPELATRWDTMQVPDTVQATIDATAQQLVGQKPRYVAVETAIGVPWFMLAVLHYRQTGIDFAVQLMTGEPIAIQGTQYPFHGPYASWEESAIDAMNFVGLDHILGWKWEQMLYELVLYDTATYAQRGFVSPFLWAFSDQYERGKVTDNNTFEPQTVDALIGCAPLLRWMQGYDASVILPREAF